jgi:hypothetical protein
MGKRGDGYGSEDHLRRYLSSDRAVFDAAVVKSLGPKSIPVEWLAFPATAAGDREFRGLEFLRGTPDDRVLPAWRAFWPPTGRAQTWDLIGRADRTWLLVEAKATWPEFVTSSCRATGEGLATIKRSLNRVKRELGVNRWFDWTSTYYQHANRLATVWFLRNQGVDARLVEVHFLGDEFPDGTPCPRTKGAWEALIEARRLTLGLAKRNRLSRFEHHVFLKALAPSP